MSEIKEAELRCSVCGCLESETPKFYKNTIYGENLCNKHYIQMNRHGEIRDTPERLPAKGKVCCICGDNRRIKYYYGNDVDSKYVRVPLCYYHHSQVSNLKEVKDFNKSPLLQERVCCICGKTEEDTRIIYYKEDCKMYCLRHYSQIKNLGGLKERTRLETNLFNKVIVDGEEVVEIILEDKNGEEAAKAIVDIDDYEKYFKNERLGLSRGRYVICNREQIQKIILNTDELVDHINLNPLDNRKCNLRIADKSKNAINCDIRQNNKSGFTGVSWNKNSNMWRVYINYDKKRVELGYYHDIKEAAEKRIEYEFKYFKEFRHSHNEENYIEKYGIEEWNKFISSFEVGDGDYE